jgi:hypothetical protein
VRRGTNSPGQPDVASSGMTQWQDELDQMGLFAPVAELQAHLSKALTETDLVSFLRGFIAGHELAAGLISSGIPSRSWLDALCDYMQTSRSKLGAQQAFNSDPEQLGRAAVSAQRAQAAPLLLKALLDRAGTLRGADCIFIFGPVARGDDSAGIVDIFVLGDVAPTDAMAHFQTVSQVFNQKMNVIAASQAEILAALVEARQFESEIFSGAKIILRGFIPAAVRRMLRRRSDRAGR